MGKKYSAKFFRDSMPEWKKKKDPLIAQWIYRPLSFPISAFCANYGISANSVSYFSIIIAVAACATFLFEDHIMHIVGAVLVNVWLLFDCVDGNIARSVKSQPMGEFADATSCYILLAFLFPSIGFATYIDGGYLFDKGNILMIMIGAFASVADIVARLIQQKFRVGYMELPQKISQTPIKNVKSHPNYSRIEIISESMGIGGYLPVVILLGSLIHTLDFVLLYYVLHSIGLFVYSVSSNIRKAVRIAKEMDT